MLSSFILFYFILFYESFILAYARIQSINIYIFKKSKIVYYAKIILKVQKIIFSKKLKNVIFYMSLKMIFPR